MKKTLLIAMLALLVAAAGVGAAAANLFGVTPARAASLSVETTAALAPAGSGFTYQGRLKNGTAPANGQYDFTFALYDAPGGGALIGGPLSQANRTVSEGLFTALLDFGAAAFNGDARYLEIAVRQTGGGGYTTLSPRQAITPAPYALYALKAKGYKNVVTVAQDGGDFTSIQAALNSITTNAVANRYLVWVGPGTYTERVTMKPYVDIEGSGELTTRITFAGGGSYDLATLQGASNAELRSLTVENTGGTNYAVAIYNNLVSPSLLHVTASASGGTVSNYTMYNLGGAASMNNMRIIAIGAANNNYGVLNSNFAEASMTDVTVTASGGTLNFAVANVNSSALINNVTLTASGGTDSFGVFNSNSTLKMTNVTGIASDGTFSNTGVHNVNGSSLSMSKVTLTASGVASGNNIGVNNATSDASMDSVNLNSSGATTNYGAYFFGTGIHTIDNSILTGTSNTVVGNVLVGSSRLAGGPAVGSVTCAGVYDENYTFFPNTCP
ncbi:MAG: hypothetical protein ABI670_01805 [Chloroflexota bacterium]